jgi:cytochrome P450
MQPAFHHSRIAALDQIVLAATGDMLNKWQDFYDRSLPVNITREMSSLTLAITTRALFGVDLGEKVKEIGDMINRVANLFEKPSNPVLLQARNDLQEIVDYIIRERRRNFQDTGDLLSAMILAQDEESKARMDQIGLRDQLMGLLLAGYETTANALSWTWYLLSKNL